MVTGKAGQSCAGDVIRSCALKSIMGVSAVAGTANSIGTDHIPAPDQHASWSHWGWVGWGSGCGPPALGPGPAGWPSGGCCTHHAGHPCSHPPAAGVCECHCRSCALQAQGALPSGSVHLRTQAAAARMKHAILWQLLHASCVSCELLSTSCACVFSCTQ